MSAVAVVSCLAAARKAAQLYPPRHPEFIGSMDALSSAIVQGCNGSATGTFTLNLHQGRLYHESDVLPDETPGVTAMAEAFESRRIESMSLQPDLSTQDLAGLVEVLGMRPSPTFDAEAELATRGITGVTISVILDEEDAEAEERDRIREQDRALYRKLISSLKQMTAQVVAGDFRQIATDSMVSNVVARIMDDQAAVLGLATLRSASEAEAYHAVNVMIYSLTLGAELGLPPEGLSSLGTGALTHDIGKAAFERDDPAQAEAMRTMHSKVGADILSGLASDDPTPMLVAYEHHMHVDGSGNPERTADYVGHPFSRMVAIANRYANLTAGHEVEPMTPDKAIVQILRDAGSMLDPLFSRLFAKALGVFPVGCLVRLSDSSVGVVSRAGSDPLTPHVRVAWNGAGMALEKPVEVDLDNDERTIVEVVDPASLNTEIADHL